MIRGDSEYGGSAQAESPEWMPASSMCSMTAPMIVSLSVGDHVDVDLDRVGEEAIEQQRILLFVARLRGHRARRRIRRDCSRSYTISIARPPST